MQQEKSVKLLSEFCLLILIDDDSYCKNDELKLRNFIENLTTNDITFLWTVSDSIVKNIVEDNLDTYIARYYRSDGLNEPFSFDSGENYDKYQQLFNNIFTEIHGHNIPEAFLLPFKIIKEKSVAYSEFSKFYKVQLSFLQDVWIAHVQGKAKDSAVIQAEKASKQAEEARALTERISTETKQATTVSQKAAEDAATSAKIALQKAQNAANSAVDNAIKSIFEEHEIEKAIEKSIDVQMNKVTSKMSETSVTILGIFAGIVLTIVAGLFYSSSVIESINSASIPKLILVASLVGFICINIIAVMFHYIDRFRVNKTTDTKELYTLKEEASKDVAELDLTEDKKTNKRDLQSLKKDKNSSDTKSSKKRVLSNKGFSYYFNAFKENHTFVYLLNFVLLIVLAISIGLYVWFCKHPFSQHENIIEQSNSNISVDVNISKGDATTTDSNTMDSPIDREPLDKSALDETTDSTLSDIVNTPSPDNIAP